MRGYPVFVIDDDEAVRDSLVAMLRAQGVTARAFQSGDDFFARLPDVETACIITDIRMPGMAGDEVVRRLSAEKGRAWSVIVITGHADVSLAVAMMKAGAVDFIEKPLDPTDLLASIDRCLGIAMGHSDTRRVAGATRDRLHQLSERERQVFDFLVEGFSNKDIALKLGISPRTVESFRAKVMSKMQADSLSALVRMALEARAL